MLARLSLLADSLIIDIWELFTCRKAVKGIIIL